MVIWLESKLPTIKGVSLIFQVIDNIYTQVLIIFNVISFVHFRFRWKNEMTALTEEFETKLKKLKIKKRNDFSKDEAVPSKSDNELTKGKPLI